jgi:hydroxyacylglutathione hydrolase
VDIIPILTGIANFYLLRGSGGFALVDCGSVLNRGRLRRALREAGCRPGDLKLVIVTHADFDHTGNADWLQRMFHAPVLVHRAELPAVSGNMFDSRTRPVGRFVRGAMRVLGWLFARRFKPDIVIDGETDLGDYGLEARIVLILGHTQGSIGVLTSKGDLCCGDLLNNSKGTPVKNWLVDVPEDMDASVAKLDALGVRTVYPGHGQPFTWEDFMGR